MGWAGNAQSQPTPRYQKMVRPCSRSLGHTLDAAVPTAGEVRELSATMAVRRTSFAIVELVDQTHDLS